MANHSGFVTLAKKMIVKEGRKVNLQILGLTAADLTKPWKGASSDIITSDYPAFAVFLPAAGRDLGTIVVDKDLLKKASHVAIVEPVAENLEEKITRIKDIDGTMWRVAWCQALKPATLTVLYVLGLNK